MQSSFRIVFSRTDKWFPAKKVSKIYDLRLTDFFQPNVRTHILRIIKKAILSTNYIYLYSNHEYIMSLFLHIFVFNLSLICGSKCSFFEKYTSKNTKDSLLIRVLVLNSFHLLYVLGSIFFIKRKYQEISKVMAFYGNCSITSNNDECKYINCSINESFDLEIESQNKYKNCIISEPIKDSIFFDYAISIPNIGLTQFYIEKALTRNENEIISGIILKMNEIKQKIRKKLTCFLFSIFVLGVSVLYRLDSFTALTGLSTYFVLIMYSWTKQNELSEDREKDLEDYAKEKNKSLMKEGYFINISSNVISIFRLKSTYWDYANLITVKRMHKYLLNKFYN